MEVANSVMVYGSEIWVEMLEVKKRANLLVSVQRTAALRIALAYRTVSSPAVLVIACAIPVDLLAAEWMEDEWIRRSRVIISGKTPLQNGNDDGTKKIEKSVRRDLSRTLTHGLIGNLVKRIITP